MKIAIIGDIHSNIVNLKKSLDIVKKRGINQIICVGDLQSLETIDIIGTTFIKTSIIFGNADWDREAFLDKAKKYKNIKIFGDVGELKFDAEHTIVCNGDEVKGSKQSERAEAISNNGKFLKIAFCHYPQTAKKLAKEKDFNVIFCGHWHSPWEEKVNGTLIIRPGEIAGHYYRPTFCIFDLDTMKAELSFI